MKKSEKKKPAPSGNEQQEEKQATTEQPVGEQAKSEQRELVEQLQRLQAEFENYKKRTEREFSEYRERVTGDVLTTILPVLDNFELALKNAKPEEKDGFYKGVELLYAQLAGVLHELGVEEIPTEGRFDPRLHEAMLTEEQQGVEKNTIIEVLQKGYRLKERVLRTAKVKVAK
ncbi:nucleotide exchange factor GrpE [Candidatus Woesearchaeota archaeon]|nr:MAG: nucleotide exchange factor GrpE [Candidatus Woesearchaeota archaeon]